jgi:cytosine deaminase
MALDADLTHVASPTGASSISGIAGEDITTIGNDVALSLSNCVPILDVRGDLVLTGIVDGHMRLDKTLMGLPSLPHAAGPTRMSRIATDKRVLLPYLPVSTAEHAGNLYRGMRRARHRASAHPLNVDIDRESRC